MSLLDGQVTAATESEGFAVAAPDDISQSDVITHGNCLGAWSPRKLYYTFPGCYGANGRFQHANTSGTLVPC